MDKTIFLEHVIAARLTTGKSVREVAMVSKLSEYGIKNFEKVGDNFNMKKVVAYLDAVRHKIVLGDLVMESYDTIKEWMLEVRKSLKLNQVDMSERYNIQLNTLQCVETGIVSASIDLFLLYTNITDVHISFQVVNTPEEVVEQQAEQITRQDFCKMLIEAKVRSGVATSALVFGLQMMPTSLVRFEKGKHNFNLKTMFSYLQFLNADLIIANKTNNIRLSCYNDLMTWFEGLIANKQNNVWHTSFMINLSKNSLYNIKSERNIMSIDTFLKLINTFGYQITIENNTK